MNGTIPTSHLTAATRALLDHVDAHGLPFPNEIAGPRPHEPGRPALTVYITTRAHAAAWLASVVVDHEDNDVRGSALDGKPYIRTLAHGRLPDTGVRVVLHVLRDLPLVVAS